MRPDPVAGAPAAPSIPIRALIFDMDGLLVDTEDLAAAALERFLAERGREMRPGTMERTLGRRLPEAIGIVARDYDLREPLPDLVDAYDRLRLDALRGNVRAMPGAAEIVRWARGRGLSLALATSSLRSHAEVSLGEAGLAGSFHAEATGAEVARGKPAPDIFLLAASRLAVEPAACAVLEDAPAGLAAAVAAGMTAIWVPDDKTRGLMPPTGVAVRCANLFEAQRWLEERVSASA